MDRGGGHPGRSVVRVMKRGGLPMLFADGVVAAVCTLLAFAARFNGTVAPPYDAIVVPLTVSIAFAVPLLFALTGIYDYIWRYAGVDAFLRLAVTNVAGMVLLGLFGLAYSRPYGLKYGVPLSVVFVYGATAFLGFVLVRNAERLEMYVRSRQALAAKRTLVIGAGDAGAMLLNDLEQKPMLGYRVVGFIDDDPEKLGRRVRMARVLGTLADLERVAKETKAEEVFVAIPSADSPAMRSILKACGRAGVHVRVVPSLVLRKESVSFSDLEEIDLAQVLGREVVRTDMTPARQSIEGRCVLVTGAAGSIGAELCRQIAALGPSRLVMLEVDESRLYETFIEISDSSPGVPQMALCDIRNASKLQRVIESHHPHMVVHAAAYKHVPLMEAEPDEAVRANVFGTANLIEACRRARVERFVLISTDKAVHPTSVMGLTKAVAERLVIEAAEQGMHACAVRFGNVLGSRGSVIPVFEQRLKRGAPVNVAHPDIDRYFMTISEAVQLVLQAQALSSGGDLFVLDMGEPVKIIDLAQTVIELNGGAASLRFGGMLSAEKLHEVLVSDGDELVPTECPKVLRATRRPLSKADIPETLVKLRSAAERNDRERMLELMRDLVEETPAPLRVVPRTKAGSEKPA